MVGRTETYYIGLWLRRSRVRAPSVTLSFAGKTQLSMALAESCGSGRAAVELNCDMLAAVVDKRISRRLIFTLCSRNGRVYRIVSRDVPALHAGPVQRVGDPSVAIAAFGVQPHGRQGLMIYLRRIDRLPIRVGVGSVLRLSPYSDEDLIADPAYVQPEVPFGNSEVLA